MSLNTQNKSLATQMLELSSNLEHHSLLELGPSGNFTDLQANLGLWFASLLIIFMFVPNKISF